MSSPSKCKAKDPASCRVHGLPLLTVIPEWSQALEKTWGVQVGEVLDKASASKVELDDILVASEDVAESWSNLTFLNHATEGLGGYVSLADMANPDIAYNNCDACSAEIVERLTAEHFDADSISYVGVETEGSEKFHAAVLVIKNGNYYVADYTIRQFDATLPYPYVDTKDNWVAKLAETTGLSWSDSRRNMG